MIDLYENKLGPRNGARVVAKAWSRITSYNVCYTKLLRTENTDDLAALQALLDAQDRVWPSGVDHALAQAGCQRLKRSARFWSVRVVHDDVNRDASVEATRRTQHLEAAEMRAQQYAAAPSREHPLGRVRTADGDVEDSALAA